MKVKLNEMVEIKENEDLEKDADIEIFEWAVSDGDDVKKGDKIVLTAFGAGFTWGASYLIWGM